MPEGEESLHPTTAADTEAAAAAAEAAGGEGGDQQKQQQQQQEQQSGEQTSGKPKPEPGSALLGSYGNSVGDKVQSTLSPIGQPLGKGLGTIASPVGGLVEPLVGGVMKSGAGFGDTVGVGAGNQDAKKRAEMERAREPVGGKEQTAGNPLGLGEP
ncbi:MAG: hypothetical protein LQ344_004493 [Seirophora lacunosa]|nr:MAG: hypothetical protein LQ344_004493 [Seirophora lacunosa]